MNKVRNKIKATAILLLTAIIWGFAFVAQRVGADYVSTFTFNTLRFSLGAVSLLPVIFLFERKKEKRKAKATLTVGIVAGIIMFAAINLQQYGIFLTQSAGKAGFITSLYIVLVPLIGILLGKRAGTFVILGALLSVFGLYLLCGMQSFYFSLGEFVLLLGAFLWAIHLLIIDRFVNGVNPLRFAFVQFFVCAALCSIFALVFELNSFSLDNIKIAALPIFYGGVMSVGIAYTCQIIGQKYASPAYASILLSTESVFGAIGGAFILGETMDSLGYLGSFLIFLGILISQLKFSRKTRESKLKSAL